MHLERVFDPEKYDFHRENETGQKIGAEGRAYRTDDAYSAAEADRLSGVKRQGSWEKSVANMSSYELDKELADVYAREFGMNRGDMEEEERRKRAQEKLRRKAEAEERRMIDTLFQLLHEVGAVILLEDIRRLQNG